MRRLPAIIGLAALGAVAGTGGARAQDATANILSELRLGIFDHDSSGPEAGSVDVNAEALFAKPLRLTGTADLLIPHPHLGATVSTAGKTSAVYAGLTWQVPLGDLFFAEASLGAAFHNGSSDGANGEAALGCSPLFRESVSLGMKLGRAWTLLGTVDHMSNAGLCDRNRGMTHAGVRVGYRF